MSRTTFWVLACVLIVILGLVAVVQNFPSTRATGPSATAGSQPATGSATRNDRRRIHAFVSGKVQGVGFRAFTQEQAEKLKLAGFVRNLKDGRVEVVAEGGTGDVSALLAKIKQGPRGARVDKVDSKEETPTGESHEFNIDR